MRVSRPLREFDNLNKALCSRRYRYRLHPVYGRAALRVEASSPIAAAILLVFGFDPKLNSFVQSYGAQQLDASLLMLPLVGFLPADDARIRGTMAAIERCLLKDGFVARYNTENAVDGLPGDEGAFLACGFWLADNYILQGRHDDARALFERLLELRNDVGLLAEEYDPIARRLVGNYPQAFSHVALINTAHNLTRAFGPAQHRAESQKTIGHNVDTGG
jgi:GH15 family glucan-1,4-alpha-glucosidase